MPTFMCFLNWTDQGAKAVKEAPQRYEMLKGLVAGLSGRVVSAYVTTGQYDVAVTLEMPDGDAMTKLSIALTSRGFVRRQPCGRSRPRSSGSLPPRRRNYRGIAAEGAKNVGII